MSNSQGYMRRLIKVKCDCGNMENYLNVKEDHGVIWYACDAEGNVCEERPLMNANDHEGDVNLMNFGRCHAESNKIFGGKRTFNVGSLLDGIGYAWNSTLESLPEPLQTIARVGTATDGCDGYLCTPYFSQPWLNVKENVILDGAPAITGESTVTCYYGGKVTIYVEEQTHGGGGKSRSF